LKLYISEQRLSYTVKDLWHSRKYPYCVWKYNKAVSWQNKPIGWCAYCISRINRGDSILRQIRTTFL